MSDESKTAATIIRSIASTASTVGAIAVADPIAGGVVKGVSGLLEVVANLVERLGTQKAEEVLRELDKNPAQPITEEQLKADVEKVKREFGIG